uniref:Uncharacterized protein n=1 Tax=Cyprinus carpio TaxID=7962 RepID=A0A8C2HT14_CYPCA
MHTSTNSRFETAEFPQIVGLYTIGADGATVDSYSGTLTKGQKIGTLLPMQEVYPGITSHVYVQMCDKSDPTKYF